MQSKIILFQRINFVNEKKKKKNEKEIGRLFYFYFLIIVSITLKEFIFRKMKRQIYM
jgi:hypothetical protein